MTKIETCPDFAGLYFSRECVDWRKSNLVGQTSINHAERFCSFEDDQDAILFRKTWEGKGYTPRTV
jgi:hypothetical protein